jgi:hypothetical protein
VHNDHDPLDHLHHVLIGRFIKEVHYRSLHRVTDGGKGEVCPFSCQNIIYRYPKTSILTTLRNEINNLLYTIISILTPFGEIWLWSAQTNWHCISM